MKELIEEVSSQHKTIQTVHYENFSRCYTSSEDNKTCHWDFNDFRYWNSAACYYTCGSGTNQNNGSPINIVTKFTKSGEGAVNGANIKIITDMNSEKYKRVKFDFVSKLH